MDEIRVRHAAIANMLVACISDPRAGVIAEEMAEEVALVKDSGSRAIRPELLNYRLAVPDRGPAQETVFR